jgi:N-6 DNA Methylase
MAVSDAELRRRLTEFAAKWDAWQGTERSEAIPFLIGLLACFDVDKDVAGARFEVKVPSGYIDMLWPGVCLVEMKRPSETKRLLSHRKQAMDYWHESGSEAGDPPKYVVLSSFQRFIVLQPGFGEPRADFTLVELPEKREALGFLGGLEPRFSEDRADLTREAVALVTELYRGLVDRLADGPDILRDFILQCVWCMFAEDLGLLPSALFTKLLEGLITDSTRSSREELGLLFEYLDTKGGAPSEGRYSGTPYANGQLFEKPTRVHLQPDEVKLLREACAYNWRQVEPSIFGSLLQGALGRERQWALGAHYTAEADIMHAVGPTIIEPWRERIDACTTLEDVKAAQDELAEFVVLDPACGSGNFLYVAYRELRALEKQLADIERKLRRAAGLREEARTGLFRLANLRGIETEPFAVKLARVTLWMGHALAVHELSLEETVLPLADLSGIQLADALKIEWPEADAVVGNPPYHGSQRVRRELGDAYADWLKEKFGIGLKDYAVYWFRKAHERLGPDGRAGLVATNSISQGRGRKESLEWIVMHGGVIVNAISSKDWSGEAAVDVSIVNWIKNPLESPDRFVLDGKEVDGISPALRSVGSDVSSARGLARNRGLAFQGPIPAGNGFVLDPTAAAALLRRTDADYGRVVRPYLVGDDITNDPAQQPTRWIIDFGQMPIEEARNWPAALDVVQRLVKPARAKNNRRLYREKWWIFAEPRPGMRHALEPLPRFVAGIAQGKRIHFCWCEPEWCPSNLTNVFAIEDDYRMGVLLSSIHHEWARAQSSTLEDRFRYTPTSAFETFPFPPSPSDLDRERIADLSREIIALRKGICAERNIGLTRLYNELEDGAYADLSRLHASLDRAVADAYGWPAAASGDTDESNRRLLALNDAIRTRTIDYAPFAQPVSAP